MSSSIEFSDRAEETPSLLLVDTLFYLHPLLELLLMLSHSMGRDLCKLNYEAK